MKLLKLLGWLVFHRTNRIHEKVSEHPEMRYTEYRIYRIWRLFGIPIHFIEATFNSLGSGPKQRANYYYNNEYAKLP